MTISPKMTAIEGAAAPEIIEETIPRLTSAFWLAGEYLKSLRNEIFA